MTRRPLSDEDLQALYREAARAEPSPLLDHLIRDAARAELPKPVRRRPWWTAWLAPVSLAAVALLAVSVSVRVADEDTRRAVDERGAHEPEKVPAKSPGAAPSPATVTQPERVPAAPRPVVPSAEPAPPWARVQPPAANVAPEVRMRSEKAIVVESPGAAPAPAAKDASSDVAGRAVDAASSLGKVAPMAAPAPPAAATNAPERSRRAPAAADTAGAPAAPAQALSGSTARRRDALEGEPVRAAQPSAAAETATARMKSEAKADRVAEPASPEAWIQQIRELRAAGHDGEAARSLARLRERYPGYELPEDLR